MTRNASFVVSLFAAQLVVAGSSPNLASAQTTALKTQTALQSPTERIYVSTESLAKLLAAYQPSMIPTEEICYSTGCYHARHDFVIDVTGTSPTVVPKITLTLNGFASAALDQITYGAPPCPTTAFELKSQVGTGQVVHSADMFPAQGRWVQYCDITVGAGDVVRDNIGTLTSHATQINGPGTSGKSVKLGSPIASSASYRVVISTYAKSPGALKISGYIEAYGLATTHSKRGRAEAFSHAALSITGTQDVSDLAISWGPQLTVGAGGGNSAAFDPINFAVFDKAGKARRNDALLDVQMSIQSPGGVMHWKKGNGVLAADSDQADLKVDMPGNLANPKAHLEFGVRSGRVSTSQANGAFKKHQTSLPKNGAKAATAVTGAKPGNAALTMAPRKHAITASGAVPSTMQFKVKVPALAAGEKFELRLGGGGRQRSQ